MCLVAVTIVFAIAVVAIFALIYRFCQNRRRFRPESIAGKRVLVTGAASGIGEQIAYHYSSLRAAILIVDRREQLLKQVAAKCETLGAKQVVVAVADLALPAERDALVRRAQELLGGLDHLILNHGIMTAYLWLGTANDMATLQHQMNVNFFAHVDIASKCEVMLRASRGSVGVVGTLGAKLSTPYTQSYAASKAALMAFFAAYRQELDSRKADVSVTLVVLGFVKTQSAVDIISETFPTFDERIFRSASAKGAALAIVRGVSTRAPEVYYPCRVWPLSIAHSFFPHLIESMVASQLATTFLPPPTN